MRRILLIFVGLLLPFLSKSEVIEDKKLHLYIEINKNTKEAIIGTGEVEEKTAFAYPPLEDPWWTNGQKEKFWENIEIPSTITYQNESYTIVGIAQYAFHKATEIKTITLPETIRTIGENAFSWCVNIKEIHLPSQLTKIAASTFYLCHQLENIVLPSGIETIAASAFRECWNLKKINIPGQCTQIGDEAFSWCTSLSNIILEDGEAPLKCGYSYSLSINYQGTIDKDCFRGIFADCPADTVYIGRTFVCPIIKGCTYRPFLSISNYGDASTSAYRGFTGKNFDKLIFGEGVTEIMDSLFCSSTIKNEILFPKTLKTIGKGCFYSSWSTFNQDRLTIPESVTSIGDCAFQECGINELILLGPCENMGITPFLKCRIQKLIIGKSVKSIPSFTTNNINYVECLPLTPPSEENKFGTLPIIVSDGAGAIYRQQWNDAFIVDRADAYVTINVKTPGSLYSRLLAQDYQLETVYKLKLKGNLNDDDLNTLSSMTNVHSYDFSELKLEELPTGFFQGRDKVFHVELPQILTKISDNEFRDCKRLEGKIVIPASCYTIGEYAFENTNIDSLKCLGVVNIRHKAFSKCKKLNYVDFEDTIIVEDSAFISSNIDKVIIPPGSILYPEAFIESNLKQVTLADNVQKLGEDALGEYICRITFLGMIDSMEVQTYPNLKEIHVSNIETWCKLPFPDTEIMNQRPSLYIGNEIVENILIPENLVIRDYAFYNCSTLKSVKLPSEISVIPKGAFKNCTNLTSFEMPQSVSVIEAEAFNGCCRLSNVELPQSLISVGGAAFAGCDSIKILKLPINITSIGEGAFSNCQNIHEIRAQWQDPFTISDNTFNGVASDCYLYIPIMTANKYRNAGWNVPNMKEAGVLTVSIKGNGEILYEENIVRNKSEEFLYTPYKSFYLTISPDEGFSIKRLKLNGEDVRSLIEDGKLFIEEPEQNFFLESVFVDSNLKNGDVNSDYVVDTIDVTSIVNYILKYPSVGFYDYLADVNEDGVVNITDALLVVSYILNDNK